MRATWFSQLKADVPDQGHVGQQRVVAGILPVMRIEAAKRPAHGGPGAHHRAVDVIVRRNSVRRWTAPVTRSWLIWTSGATVACVSWHGQLPTARAVGTVDNTIASALCQPSR